MPMQNIPIRRKLTLIILVITAVVMLLMRGAFFTYEYLAFRQGTLSHLSSLGHIIAANSTAALAFENPDDGREILSALKAEPQVVAAALYDRNGRLFSQYPADGDPALFPREPGAAGYSFSPARLSGFEPIALGDRNLGTLYLEYDTGILLRIWLWDSFKIALGVMAVILGIAYVLSRRLERQVSQPILQLAETARAITERRDYTVRAPKLGNDELGQLTHAFNQLLVQIHAQKTALDEHAIVAITDHRGRITYVNDKFCAISKYPREELIGQDHRIINSSHHPKEFFRNLWTTIAQGRVWHGEIRNRAKDGSLYWVETTIVPFLDANGKPYEYVAIRADITQRVQAQEQIERLNQDLENRVAQRTAQLQAANAELEAFSYSVSHDLRAPLRHVDGFANLLQKSSGTKLDDQGRRYLATISNAARQMGRLIDDLLSFSRMGRANMQLAEVDQDNLVGTVMRDGRYPAGIEWRIAPLPRVQGDHAMLRQVWSNLIDNAVKYSGKVAQPVIEIGSRVDEAAAETVFFVRDNGAGFDMRYAAKLFGVFQRLHGASEFEGTGIGLANVRRIITRHGGRTWAEGEVGRGATIYFSLPHQPPTPPAT